MSEVNKCNVCGKFKPWEGLKGLAGDCDEIGNYDQWFECVDCMCGSDLREFAKQKIKEITALKAELSEFMDGLPIEKADKKEEYYFKDNNHLTRIKWNEQRSSWCNSLCVQMDYENEWIKTVYPLPSETKEGS